MSNSINWGALYERGRCKAIGIPWSDAEKEAVYILKIPADYVRLGCLTKEAYEAMLAEEKGEVEKTGKKSLVHLRKEQLYKLCLANGVNATPEATKATLLDELKAKGVPASIPVDEVPA